MAKKLEDKAYFLDCLNKLEPPEQQMTSQVLSKNLITQLMHLIDQVNKDQVTADSVKASCMCAEQVYKLLRLNFDIKKQGF